MRTTEDVWRAMRGELRSYLRGRVADEHAVDDLLQETFARVHARLGEVPTGRRLEPWVLRIARNAVVDHYRRAGRTDEMTDDAAPAGDPDEASFDRNAEVVGWLPRFAALLPPGTRAAVELSDLRGLPLRAVADELGISLTAAKSRVQRGRARMRELLEQCCRFELDRRGNVLDYRRRGDDGSCSDC